MALTMTRTRTQTTLTRLVELIANLNGELEFVDELLRDMPEHAQALGCRHGKLSEARQAVLATLQQFDPSLVTASIVVV